MAKITLNYSKLPKTDADDSKLVELLKIDEFDSIWLEELKSYADE